RVLSFELNPPRFPATQNVAQANNSKFITHNASAHMAWHQPPLELPLESEQLWHHTRVTALFEDEQDPRKLWGEHSLSGEEAGTLAMSFELRVLSFELNPPRFPATQNVAQANNS
ncbi:MAG: hypothetical protein KZQ97_22000, partial [Candidatus Thiodiazotropha sp. (ex Dulcina madagascariensis)]|nr:hypothetical protein [Candidatus Thiodiazotropha sp. (ex Dulcina madagascariensis)]